MIGDLKTRISAFELQSYSDLAGSLVTASENGDEHSKESQLRGV